MAANAWAHFFFLVDLGVMPATKVVILPYLVTVVYLSTFVRYSDFELSIVCLSSSQTDMPLYFKNGQ